MTKYVLTFNLIPFCKHEVSVKADSEVKKAFRRMAVKFHPDKVRDMGADYQKQARTRFDRITTAYEAIKKQRGIK